MSDEEPKSPISAEISVKAEVSANIPDESVAAGTNALLDIISPFTHGMGAIGDCLKYYREDLLVRHLTRARDTAERHGIEISPPKPKFLVEYVEQVSLEDTESPDLQQMWANLLLRSSDIEPENGLIYIDILKKLTGEQAVVLQELHDKQWTLYPYKDREYRNSDIMTEEEVQALQEMSEDEQIALIQEIFARVEDMKSKPVAEIRWLYIQGRTRFDDFEMAPAIDQYYFLEGLSLVRLTPFRYQASRYDEEIILEGKYVQPTTLLEYLLDACTLRGGN